MWLLLTYFVSAASRGCLISTLIFCSFIRLHACSCFLATTKLYVWFSEGALLQVHLSSGLSWQEDWHWSLFHTKNISMRDGSSLQRSLNQTTVFCVTHFESFIAFLQTPGCCLLPSGHSPTQSRFVKCCTDCCLSRNFSCSSQGAL